MSEKIDYSKGVYDAKKLGTGRMFILGVQHMFAMFGATVLVPLLTGLSVSTTLLCAGLGTLLFHLITKKKVPAFLGSSFAYLGGFSIVAPMLADADGNLTVANTKMLPYACAAIAFSGLVYLVASLLISTFGIRRIMKFFPPVVTGPIIISIGLILAAGLDGIENRMELRPPVNKNLFIPSEAVGLGLETLPTSLEEAVEVAKNSEFLHKFLPEELAKRYYAESLKRCAALKNAADPAEYERIHYFNAI
mgnify:FL=1